MSDEEYVYQITRNGVMRSDGVLFLETSFEIFDGGNKVPLIWNGCYYKPDCVLGHALLKSRKEGIFATLIFNNTESGRIGRKLLDGGDADVSFSASGIKRDGPVIKNGHINAVHLCPSGCGFTYEED